MIATRPALALALFLLAGPAAASSCASQLTLSAGRAGLAEHTGYGKLTEEAVWPGLGGRAAWPLGRHCLTLDGSWRGGTADYDGFLQPGGTPYRTTSDQTLLRGEMMLTSALDERFALALQLGTERFLRDIQPRGAVPGLTETYTWVWLAAGADWHACRGCVVSITGRLRLGVLAYGASDVDLGSAGQVDISLDDGTFTRLELEGRLPDSPWHLALYSEQRDFARSEPASVSGGAGTAYQPAFDVGELGLALRRDLD
ncbi:MAG: hypothetical protein ACOY3X_07860 [Pseudomonadota bacterium]